MSFWAHVWIASRSVLFTVAKLQSALELDFFFKATSGGHYLLSAVDHWETVSHWSSQVSLSVSPSVASWRTSFDESSRVAHWQDDNTPPAKVKRRWRELLQTTFYRQLRVSRSLIIHAIIIHFVASLLCLPSSWGCLAHGHTSQKLTYADTDHNNGTTTRYR